MENINFNWLLYCKWHNYIDSQQYSKMYVLTKVYLKIENSQYIISNNITP